MFTISAIIGLKVSVLIVVEKTESLWTRSLTNNIFEVPKKTTGNHIFDTQPTSFKKSIMSTTTDDVNVFGVF